MRARAVGAPLIAFRALQGLGAALIFPVSVSVLTNAFPAVKASHAIGLAYGIAGLGNAAGPLIGGLLTDTVGWRWIFWLNVPLTLVSLAIGCMERRRVVGSRLRRVASTSPGSRSSLPESACSR